jgi:predicted phosphodiesterase
MAAEVIRIFSDLHYGDRSSRITRLAALAPLAEGADAVILNGDTLDTRPGPAPAFTAACQAEIAAFFAEWGPPVTFLTGNHDPDHGTLHCLDRAEGRIFITHGDVLYPDIVPWGRDAPLIRRKIELAWQSRTQSRETAPLAERFEVLRQVAATVPQRHQSERSGMKYYRQLAVDTMWPPWRIPRIMTAWGAFPLLADEFLRNFRPHAQVMLNGHTHRPGIWRRPSGAVLVNTGSLCRPFGALAADLSAEMLRIRAIEQTGQEFRVGGTVAELHLTPSAR